MVGGWSGQGVERRVEQHRPPRSFDLGAVKADKSGHLTLVRPRVAVVQER